MEHEVFVPVPADRLGEALADPARVARSIPGLQRDASADGSADGSPDAGGGAGAGGADRVVGRLKVRVGGTTITYRGTLRVTARADGEYAVEADATESRGTGSVRLTLTLRLREAEDGTTVLFGGTATADGRVTELPEETVRSAGTRLLNRFAEQLARTAAEPPEAKPTGDGAPETAEPSGKATAPAEPMGPADQADQADQAEQAEPTESAEVAEPTEPTEPAEPADQAEPAELAEPADQADQAEQPAPAPDFPESPRPPAEAAHARRTMIGRSAEEVDHAPPRGRYAPVPAPQTVTVDVTLRWVAPAAALAVASAIVLGRMLRRRR